MRCVVEGLAIPATTAAEGTVGAAVKALTTLTTTPDLTAIVSQLQGSQGSSLRKAPCRCRPKPRLHGS